MNSELTQVCSLSYVGIPSACVTRNTGSQTKKSAEAPAQHTDTLGEQKPLQNDAVWSE